MSAVPGLHTTWHFQHPVRSSLLRQLALLTRRSMPLHPLQPLQRVPSWEPFQLSGVKTYAGSIPNHWQIHSIVLNWEIVLHCSDQTVPNSGRYCSACHCQTDLPAAIHCQPFQEVQKQSRGLIPLMSHRLFPGHSAALPE